MVLTRCDFKTALTPPQIKRRAILLMVERDRWWTQIIFHSLHSFNDWLITAIISENKLPPIKLSTRCQGIWSKLFTKIKCQFTNSSMFGKRETWMHDKGRSCWGTSTLQDEAARLAGFTDADCGLITNGRANGSLRMPFLTVDSNETDEWSCRDYLAIHPA